MYIFMDGIVRKLISAGTDHLASRGSLAVDHQNHYRFLELKTRPYSLHLSNCIPPFLSHTKGQPDGGKERHWDASEVVDVVRSSAETQRESMRMIRARSTEDGRRRMGRSIQDHIAACAFSDHLVHYLFSLQCH